MKTIADYEYNATPLYQGVTLVSKAIRPNFDVESVDVQVAELVRQARKRLPPEADEHTRLQILITLFYKKWQFMGASGVYSLADALWLDNVLRNHKGSAASLGILFHHLAQSIGLNISPVIFPTQLILRVDFDDEVIFLDPNNGEQLDNHILDAWLKSSSAEVKTLTSADVEESENSQVIRKYLDSIKMALMAEKKMEQALKVCETILLFDPEDPYEIRDRGLIYAQLDCSHIAISDLSYFVEQCPQDPVTEMIKMQIHTIEHQNIVLH